MYKIGTIIKREREKQCLTQEILADTICSLATLKGIESNQQVPTAIVMYQLCQKLALSIDQVMGREADMTEPKSQCLALMADHYQRRNFKALSKLINQEDLLAELVTLEAKQRYDYYCACCLYEQEGALEACVKLLQQSLNYTYNNKKKSVSDLEIILLSELGRVYFEMKNEELADYFFKKSIALFYTLPAERHEMELTKIFYNAAAACITSADYDLAKELIERGLTWSRSKSSYYFLDQLLLLKGIICQDLNQLDEASVYVEMAEMLNVIATDAHVLSWNHLAK